jgi:undecaprenyl diphosphate synthase
MIAEPATRITEQKRKIAHLPRHVAIIMDGNGRWAQQRGLSRQAGHRAGTENIRRIIECFADYEVKYLTLFAFSTENWGRPRKEVDALLRLVGRVINRELRALHRNGIRLLHLGQMDALSPRLQKQVQDAVELTKNNERMTVSIAFNYGGRAEILDAIRRIVADGVPADKIDDELLHSYLYTTGLPDPDLIIRTAGEMRLSNFLIWQSAYSEYYATPTLWPDFDGDEIERALMAYSERRRRFGLVEPENSGQEGGRPIP